MTDEAFINLAKENKYVNNESVQDDPVEFRNYMTAYMICKAIKDRKLKHILTFSNTNGNANKLHLTLEKMSKLMKLNAKCYYLTGESSMKVRNRVVEEFENDEIAIISSARIFTEGVDIPCVDCICFADNKMSVVDIIQSVGRALRKHDGKEYGYIIIPTVLNVGVDNVFDVNNSDFSTIKAVLRAIGTTDHRIVDHFVTKDHNEVNGGTKRFVLEHRDLVKYSLIDLDIAKMAEHIGLVICNRWGDANWLTMRDLLFEFCDKFGRVPKNKELYRDKHVGQWLHTIQKRDIKSKHDTRYTQLSENANVKTCLDAYFYRKEHNPRKKTIPSDETQKIFFGFYEEMKRIPIRSDVYKDTKIGELYHLEKQRIESKEHTRYIALSAHPSYKKDLDEYLLKKEKNKNREKRTFDDNKTALFKFTNEFQRAPMISETYDGHTIGSWFSKRKRGIKGDTDKRYAELSENPYIKKEIDKYLQKVDIDPFEDKLKIFIGFTEEHTRIPKRNEMYGGVFIGEWFYKQKNKIESSSDKRYIQLSSNLYAKADIDRYLEDRHKYSFETRKNALFAFCNENNRVPRSLRDNSYENRLYFWLHSCKCQIESTNDKMYIDLIENIYVKDDIDKYLTKKSLKGRGKQSTDNREPYTKVVKYTRPPKTQS